MFVCCWGVTKRDDAHVSPCTVVVCRAECKQSAPLNTTVLAALCRVGQRQQPGPALGAGELHPQQVAAPAAASGGCGCGARCGCCAGKEASRRRRLRGGYRCRRPCVFSHACAGLSPEPWKERSSDQVPQCPFHWHPSVSAPGNPLHHLLYISSSTVMVGRCSSELHYTRVQCVLLVSLHFHHMDAPLGWCAARLRRHLAQAHAAPLCVDL